MKNEIRDTVLLSTKRLPGEPAVPLETLLYQVPADCSRGSPVLKVFRCKVNPQQLVSSLMPEQSLYKAKLPEATKGCRYRCSAFPEVSYENTRRLSRALSLSKGSSLQPVSAIEKAFNILGLQEQ